MLLLVTALCLFLGWRTYHESTFRRIERRLDELQVHRKVIRQEAPRWQLGLLGTAIYTRIDRIELQDAHLRDDQLKEIVDLVASWGGVREVVFQSIAEPIQRDSYEQIARLQSLERIVFDYCEPGQAETLTPLVRLPNLREISIEITWAKSHPFPFDFYLALPSLKVLGLPSWSDEEAQYVAHKRPDLKLEITDFPP